MYYAEIAARLLAAEHFMQISGVTCSVDTVSRRKGTVYIKAHELFNPNVTFKITMPADALILVPFGGKASDTERIH